MAAADKDTRVAQPRATGLDSFKQVLNANSVREQFDNALQENSGAFIASIIDLIGSDKALQECDPRAVAFECLKAATLKLPINKQLGQAYVIAYAGKPTFQIGYKGYIQLAMRTGQYKFLNVGIVFEGITVNEDLLTGEIKFGGKSTSDKPQGYFAYMRLLNGFEKTLYMTAAEVLAHAQKYSKSWIAKDKAFNPRSAWATHFDEMAKKTTTRLLLSKYGYLSTEMVKALNQDEDSEFEAEKAANANQAPLPSLTAPEPTEPKAEPVGAGAGGGKTDPF